MPRISAPPASALAAILLAGSLLAASPALAAQPAEQAPPELQKAEPQKAERPLQDREVTAVDVVSTPLTDLNIRKDDIPALLLNAQERPYDLAGLHRCGSLVSAIGELDALLGPDVDLGAAQERGPSPGKLAQWLVGTFIPFRGALRELSGANEQQRRVALAVQAGAARRAFLKGYGEARKCRYPARAARPVDIAQATDAAELAKQPAGPSRAERKKARKARKLRDSAATTAPGG